MSTRVGGAFVIVLAALIPVGQASAAPAALQTRCGWFENPTPRNAWLHDRDGEWTIGIQGGHQAVGDWPDFTDSQWVKTNIHYGHGCACLKVAVDADMRQVLRIASARARPLRICRADSALKEPR